MLKKVESRISISNIFVVFLVLILELFFVLISVDGVLREDLENMNQVTNGLIANINQVNLDKEEVLQSFGQILDTSKETGGNVEELVPKVQEEVDALLRMKDVSMELRSLSESLAQVAESFRI